MVPRLLPAHRRLLAVLAVAFVAAVALQIHGYSLATWHDLIDGSDAPELLLGTPRAIRSDDAQVILPLAFAQSHHEPAFARVNRNIGFGQNMLVPFAAPVAHPLTALRPSTWGFFLGDDTGMAWMWWWQGLGLFAVFSVVLLCVTGNRPGLALLGSLTLTTAPFFLFWSLGPASVTLHAGLAFLGGGAVLGARRPRSILAGGLLLGLAGGAFLMALYPPFQVTLLWLLAPLLAVLSATSDGVARLRSQLGWRLGAFALAAAVVGGSALLLLSGAGDAVDLLRHTSFPGDRVSTGGDRPFWSLVSANLGVAFQVSAYGPLLNACETASFWIVSPVIGAALAERWLRAGSRPDPIALLLLTVLGMLVFYSTLGIPEWLARASGLRFVPGRRAVIGIGLADALLLARFLALRADEAGKPAVSLPVAAGIALGWTGALGACAWILARDLREFSLQAGLAMAAGNGAMALVLLRTRRPLRAAALVAAAAAASGLWWNPLVRGGADYLTTNPLAQKILAIDAEAGGKSVWLGFGSPDVPNLFRAIGVRALNGVHPVPQPPLWKELDPSGARHAVTNRYAHPAFVAQRRPDIEIRLHSPDTILVTLDPRHPALRRLGVTHVLVRLEDPRVFEQLSGFEPLGSVGRNYLFRVR